MTTADAVHTFRTTGTYSVNLTSWNSCGNSSSISRFISVLSEPCSAVQANFSSSVSAGYAPLTVSFTDNSIGGNITSWLWNFGDG